jgi:hypothetical protein
VLTLSDAQLLTQQEDFEVFIGLGAAGASEEVQ